MTRDQAIQLRELCGEKLPTKDQEIQKFKSFVENQPKNSYLASILTAIQGDVASAIRNDFGFIDWQTRMQEQQTHQNHVKELEQKAAALRTEIIDMHQQLLAIENEFKAMKTKVSDFLKSLKL